MYSAGTDKHINLTGFNQCSDNRPVDIGYSGGFADRKDEFGEGDVLVNDFT